MQALEKPLLQFW